MGSDTAKHGTLVTWAKNITIEQLWHFFKFAVPICAALYFLLHPVIAAEVQRMVESRFITKEDFKPYEARSKRVENNLNYLIQQMQKAQKSLRGRQPASAASSSDPPKTRSFRYVSPPPNE